MMIGTVLGGISVQRGIADAPQRHWVQVRCGEQILTALDPVGVLCGEQVVLTRGEQASRLTAEIPVDAVVIGVV